MNVDYLTGYEAPTADLMNRLYAALDAKLTRLLGGRSFFLAQTATMPAYLTGKTFFFTSGAAIYAPRVPGYIENNTTSHPVARPYNPAQFAAARAAATVLGYDEVNQVVQIQKVPAAFYQGLPQEDPGQPDWAAEPNAAWAAAGVGFFEWSLAAEFISRNGRRYYIQDDKTMPEKRLNFGLAEIIIEGPAGVTMEASWDKYSCFRIHNLNPKPATVTFADGGYAVKLGAFQCATVRRSLAPLAEGEASRYGNYRAGFNYFFKYEGGDPRFYWFHPTVGRGANISPGGQMTNSMQANNLTNAAILLDWVQYFQRTPDAATVFTGWADDPTVQCDIWPLYKNKFGDPANPATRLGDLLHHQGVIQIVRTSKATVNGQHIVVNDAVTFNGYATIVADFAAKKLAVTEDGNGNLVISNADPENTVQLFPISTNLCKTGEAIPAAVALPFTIEHAVFETEPEQAWLDGAGVTGGSPILATTAAQMVIQPVATTTTPTQTWYDLTTAYPNITPQAVTGDPVTTLNWNNVYTGIRLTGIAIVDGGGGYAVGNVLNPAGGNPVTPAAVVVTSVNRGRITGAGIADPGSYPSGYGNIPASPNPMTGGDGAGATLTLTFSGKVMNVHKVTVADLLQLDWWGDPAFGNQSSAWVVIENRKATLTPQGLVITFTETDSAWPDTAGVGGPWATGKRGVPRARCIHFRGHGWPFVGPPNDTEGAAVVPPSAKSGMVSPNTGQRVIGENYQGEFMAPAGGDFTTRGLMTTTNALQLLARVKAKSLQLSLVPDGYWGRFWKANSRLVAFDSLVAHDDKVAMVLLAEMYNGLARAINACTAGVPLQWQCLYFNVAGWIVNLDPAVSGNRALDGTWTPYAYNQFVGPRPMDQFGAFDPGSVYEALCGQLGIPMLTADDFPPGEAGKPFSDYQALVSAPMAWQTVETYVCTGAAGTKARLDANNQPVPVDPNDPSTYDNFWGTIAGSITTELLSTAKLLAGEATGANCLGVYDPLGTLPDFTGVTPEKFYVASDGSGNALFAGGVSNLLGGTPTPGNAWCAPLANWVNLATAYAEYRWVRIAAVRKVVEAFGFPFLFVEAVTPLALTYFEDPLEQKLLAVQGATYNWKSNTLIRNPSPLSGQSEWANIRSEPFEQEVAELNQLKLIKMTALATTVPGVPGYGTLIKFCVRNSATAEWKISADPVILFGGGGPGIPPVTIANISSHAALSPLVGFDYGATTLTVPLLNDLNPHSVGGYGWGPGIVLEYRDPIPGATGSDGTPGTSAPQMAVQYAPKAELTDQDFTDLIQVNYSDGSLMDRVQVLAFNVDASADLKPIPVLWSGTGAWKRTTDWWGNMFTAFAATFPQVGQFIPFEYVKAPQSYVSQVTGPGLTIFAAPAQTRYQLCYSLAAFDLTGISF